MKKLLQRLALSCLVVLVAGASVVPSAQSSIRDCMAESGIDMETADRADIIAAAQACREEAAAEHDARKAEKEAEMEAKIAEKRAIMESMKSCVEDAAIDPETATKEEMSAVLEGCAVEAGAITEEQLAKIKDGQEAMKAKKEAIQAEIDAQKAECEEKRAIIEQCLTESMEGVDPAEMEKEEITNVIDDCLLEAGIDTEAIRQEIEAKIEAAKQIHEEIKSCVEAIDFENTDAEASKEAIKACLPETE